MSGRPKTPLEWATGLYAAGAFPWSGTPKSISPVVRYFTPGTAAAAQSFNGAMAEIYDTLRSALDMSGLMAAQNWPSIDVTVGGSNPSYNGIAWDPKYGRWLIFGVKPATTNAFCAYVSSNGGRTWASQGGQNPSTGTPDCSIQGVIYNPSSGRLAVCTYPGVGPGDVSPLVDEEARITLSNVNGRVTGIAFNGLYIFAGNDSLSTQFLKTSPLGSNTWTSHAPVTGVTTASWCDGNPFASASSGSAVMVVKLGRANFGEYVYSTDGTTWTKKTHTATSGWYNVGLCWSVDRWVLMQTNATDSRVLVSTDGTNWSTASTLTGVFAGGVAAIGALLFATTYTHQDLRGAWSTDGGVTWQFGGSYSVTPAVAATPDPVYSNGSQFVSLSSLKTSISAWMGVPGTQGY